MKYTVNHPLGYYQDVVSDTTDQRAGATAPAFQIITGGIFCTRFDAGRSDTIFTTSQVPHGVWQAAGVLWSPHVHFTPSINIPAGATVKWEMEYCISQIGSVIPVSVTDLATYVSGAVTPAGTHLITEWTDVLQPARPQSAIILCRLTRISSGGGADTFAGNCFLIGFDWHVRTDWSTGGSRVEFP